MTRTVDVFLTPGGGAQIVATTPASPLAYVVTANGLTGAPFYSGVPSVDLFADRASALAHVRAQRPSGAAIKALGLFGIAADSRGAAFLGLVKATNVTAHLPAMHLVHTVTEVQYLPLTGADGCPFSAFQLAGNHYFCDSYDLTQFFPNGGAANAEFVWNGAWAAPFRRVGLAHLCVALVQGAALTSSFLDRTLAVTHLARRSARNPGTRYNSRGLDANNNAGNEVEGELIFADGNRFRSHGWRRGSPPIRWRTQLKTTLSRPRHAAEPDCGRGTAQYFEQLRAALGIPLVRMVSLLETAPGKSELALHNALKAVVTELAIPFIEFDVNRLLEERGSAGCRAEFEAMIEPLVDWTAGTVDPLAVETRQASLNRYNCADSLDRTNLVTFYLSLLCIKQWHPTQAMVDFLAKAFIASGNIISSLSTNTSAIKIEAIRAFAPSIPPPQSDSTVALERRLQNVAFDPARNETLLLFAHPPPVSAVVWFDAPHLAFFGDFPYELFAPRAVTALISRSSEVTVLLPRPVFVRAISIRNCSAESFMVHGDGSEILGARTIPQTAAKCTYSFDACYAARLVTIRFFSEESQFTCGNIAIAGEIPGHGIARVSLAMSDEVKADFIPVVTEFLASARTLRDVLKLEKSRILLRLSERVLIDLGARYLVNPFLWDAGSRIVSAPRNRCAFCGEARVIAATFRQNPLLLTLVVKDPEGDLPCCHGCSAVAQSVADLSDSLQSQFTTPVEIPPYEPPLTLAEQSGAESLLSQPSTASFSNQALNRLLGDNTTPVAIPANSVLRLYFHQYPIISSIALFAAVEPSVVFCEEHTVTQGEGKWVFAFPRAMIGSIIVFKFLRAAELFKIECVGRFVENEPPSCKVGSFAFNRVFQDYEYEWTSSTRTAICRFRSPVCIKRVSFCVGSPDVQNMVLCFSLGDTRTACEVLQLPRVEKGATLFYPLSKYVCDQVHVFYTDRLVRVRPHRIGFQFDPIETASPRRSSGTRQADQH
jgi:hypothetical protein